MAAYNEILASFDFKGLYQSGTLDPACSLHICKASLSSLLAAILQAVLPTVFCWVSTHARVSAHPPFLAFLAIWGGGGVPA